MDLLACSQCGCRFYVPGAGDLENRWCPIAEAAWAWPFTA
jgi:hypothetical protein